MKSCYVNDNHLINMKVQCNHCLPKEEIEIPDFTQADKKVLHEMRLKSPSLSAYANQKIGL
jgi:hypothetical protein